MRTLGPAATLLCLAAGGALTAPSAPAPSAPPPSAPPPILAAPPPVLALPGAADDTPRAEMARRAAAWTGLPERQIIAFGDGVAVALPEPAPARGQAGVITGLALQAEAVSDGAAAAYGWKSMRASVDIDCAQGRDLVRSMEVFADHGLKGPARSLKVPGGWGRPDPRAFLGGVIEAVCRHAATIATAGRTADSIPARDSVTAPDSAAPLTQSGAPARSAAAVQIISSSARADAERALAHLDGATLDDQGLRAFVAMTKVGGRTVYRGMVAGFASVAAARQFCRTRTAHGRRCLVRSGSS
ncbi:MAG TPA: SPOR domain-containing protein [Caulobacteraceae bacterium]|nr:SPOR domain-containing protein [Caulobacteraceae bacterium]